MNVGDNYNRPKVGHASTICQVCPRIGTIVVVNNIKLPYRAVMRGLIRFRLYAGKSVDKIHKYRELLAI